MLLRPRFDSGPRPKSIIMKIFKHKGKGHYIGSCIIIAAKSLEQAKAYVRVVLDRMGLDTEAVDVEEIKISRKAPITDIYLHSGDY